MSTLHLSQVEVQKLTPAQRLLVAQQQDFIKIGLRDQANLGRHQKRNFKYLHRSSLTIANLKKEFGIEPDYLIDQFNLVLWPDQWVKECQSRPWYYLIVEKSRDVDPVDALVDDGYQGTTRIVIKNLPPEVRLPRAAGRGRPVILTLTQVRAPDLEAWLRFGIMSEDPAYKSARRAVMVTRNKIDAVDQKLQRLPFRRTEARTEEEAKEEREVMRKTLVADRAQWEEELQRKEQQLADLGTRIRTLRILCSPGPVDALHRTVAWYAAFPGSFGHDAATLAVRKRDWYGVTLARGLRMSPDEVYELAFSIFAGRMRKTVTREVVKGAGLASVLGPDELARRVESRLRQSWDKLPHEQKNEYEEIAEQEARAQAIPQAQDGPVPEERRRSAVRMTGVRVERVREGPGRMLYEDGELYEGTWFSDLPHGKGVVFGHDGLYRGPFVQGRRAGEGTLVYATGERVTGTFGYRATATVEEALAQGRGLPDPPFEAEGKDLEKRRQRLLRLLREYYQDAIRRRTAHNAGKPPDSLSTAAERAKALQVPDEEQDEDDLLGAVVVEDRLAGNVQATADQVEAAEREAGAANAGGRAQPRRRGQAGVPALDLSSLATAPTASPEDEEPAAQLAKLTLSARRELALKEAPQGLSLMEEADAYADGVPQGECTVHFADGSKFVGQMVDGVVSGQGVYESCTGTVFKGHFRNGVLNGRGIMREADGRIVDGYWKDGVPQGICVEFLPNGDVYEGGFDNGLRSGRGVLKKGNGDLVTGFWMDGRLHGRADVMYGKVRVEEDGDSKKQRLVSDYGYIGRWVNGTLRGRGAHYSRYKDGSLAYSYATRFGGQYPRLDMVEEEEQRLWRRVRRTWLKRAEEEYARRRRGVHKSLKSYKEAWQARQRGEEVQGDVNMDSDGRPSLRKNKHTDYDLSIVQ